ncbi:unnamed protein product [Rhizophagus irregularis]|nr:unnamed protein product [Rhizophagus irregularis]
MSEFAFTSMATEDKHAHTLAQVVKKMDHLNLTKLDFLSIRLPLGPAVELADFVEELRENHFKTFSLRNILGELLRKYKLDGNSIEAIPLFKPARVTSLNIARVDTQKEFRMRSQCEMLGEESIGRVDYAIKDSEHLSQQGEIGFFC